MQSSGFQVGIERFTGGTRSTDKAADTEQLLARKPKKPAQETSHLFSVLSTELALQSTRSKPAAKKLSNPLSAIFSQRKARYPAAVDENSISNDQQTAQRPQLRQNDTEQIDDAANHPSTQQKTPMSDSCRTDVPTAAQQQGMARSAACQQTMGSAQTCSREGPVCNKHDAQDDGKVQQLILQPHHQSEQESPQEALQDCPICGMLLPVQQLQQHVDEELQELEELEQQSVAQPVQPTRQQQQQQEQPPWPAVRLHPVQPTPLNSLQTHKQQPSKPLQLPRLAAHKQVQQCKQSIEHKKQAVWWQHQRTARYSTSPSDQHVNGLQAPSQGCDSGKHISWPSSTEQQCMQQPVQQQRSSSVPAGHQHLPQEACLLQPLHQSALKQPARQQPRHQAVRQGTPLQLPPLKSHNQQQRPAHSRQKRARYGSHSSSMFSTVTSLQMAPSSSKGSGIDPSPGVLDNFDHWGDTRENWLDDHMIGLEGAPQSAGQCWEGLGRCAVGGSKLR